MKKHIPNIIFGIVGFSFWCLAKIIGEITISVPIMYFLFGVYGTLVALDAEKKFREDL